MESVRCRVRKIRRRPWPSAARVRPASVPARTPRGARTPAMTGRRVAWPSLSSPPVLTRRTPTKRSALRPRGGYRTPLVAYAPLLSCAPLMIMDPGVDEASAGAPPLLPLSPTLSPAREEGLFRSRRIGWWSRVWPRLAPEKRRFWLQVWSHDHLMLDKARASPRLPLPLPDVGVGLSALGWDPRG